jgi:hypothetical protein
VARGDEGGVLGPVALEGDAGPVVAPAVGLDDEAVGREVEVDLVRVVVGVGVDVIAQRLWQTGTAAEAPVAPGATRCGTLPRCPTD